VSASSSDPKTTAESILVASRALVAVAARSIASIDADVTLPQFRALVVLHVRGPQNAGALSAQLGVHASTTTRLCDRLVAKKLIRRTTSTGSRREVTLSLSVRGESLVRRVHDRRRAEIARIVARMPASTQRSVDRAMHAFADAADEQSDDALTLGWT
jgi:DNA-binding MarR family transcriptional regulator